MRVLVLFLLASGLLQAQSPVITRANYFDTGDSVLHYHKPDTSLYSFSPGGSGANVLWDFSAMDFTHPSVSTDSLFYIDPVSTPFYPVSLSADYSMSNHCYLKRSNPVAPSDSDYYYYTANNDSVCLIGHWADDGGSSLWEDHCTNLIKEISFPFAYPMSYTDPYTRFFYDMSGSDGHYLTGTNTVSADGYGTFITPDGDTVYNVLRVHSILTVRDSNDVFGIVNYTTHTYSWFSADVKGCIFTLQMSRNNPQLIEFAEYTKQIDFNTSIGNAEPFTSTLLVYPNPGDGVFTVAATGNNGIQSVEIVNAMGQRVCSVDNAGPLQSCVLDLSAYGSGVYFARIVTGEGIRIEKMVVE